MLDSELVVGPATRLFGARLQVRDPASCTISIGAASNVQCTIVLERHSSQVHIGSRTHIGGSTLLDAACNIDIGDDVLIAFEVLIMDHDSHSLFFEERKNDVSNWIAGTKDWTSVNMAPIHIADKAWIGARAILLKGISIGEGAVVAAGSVVTKDVAPWTVVAGNPAKVIRSLNSEDQSIA
jgi:acetyltransferase-like isoleucine patch superfamily enzyme